MGDYIAPAEFSALRQASKQALAPQKGVLRSLFDFLDLPGNVIQNILTKGNFEGAGRNLIDIATGLSGLRFLGVPELSRDDKDRPDVGFLGEILLDPLTYIGLPGNLAGKVAGKTGKAALQATSRALTKEGLEAVSQHGARSILPKLLDPTTARNSLTLMKRWTAKYGADEAGKLIQQLAQRRAMRQTARGIQKGALPEFLKAVKEPLTQGGIRLGLPFTTGRTVGLKGVDVLEQLGKYTLPGRVAKHTKDILGPPIKQAVGKFAPKLLLTEQGKMLVDRAHNAAGARKAADQVVINKIFGGFDKGLRQAIGSAVGSDDAPRAIAKLLDDIPDEALRTQVATSLTEYKKLANTWADDLMRRGLIDPQARLPEWYYPAQLLEEADVDKLTAALAPETISKQYGVSPGSQYLKPKKFKDIEDFKEFAKRGGKEVDTDIMSAALKRANAQARMVSTADLIRQSNLAFGEAGQEVAENAARLLGGRPRMPSDVPSLLQGLQTGPGFHQGNIVPTPLHQLAEESRPLQKLFDEATEGIRRTAQPPMRQPVGPRGLPTPIGPRAVQDPARRAAQTLAGEVRDAQRTLSASIEHAVNLYIPPSMRNKIGVVFDEGRNSGMLGFTKKGGGLRKDLQARFTRALDGAFEISDLPKGAKGEQVAAAAWRESVRLGRPVRFNEALSRRWAPRLQKLTDETLEQYLRQQRGKITPTPFINLIEHNAPMRLFRKGVTVGLGPFVNMAFITRNMMTGVFQAATDPQIGLVAGFKHFGPIFHGLVNKVGKKLGIQTQGDNVYKMLTENALQRGDDIGKAASGIADVTIGNYTGKQVLDLAKRHSVIRQGYTGVEELLEQTVRPKTGWIPNWATGANEYVENAMRLSAYSDMLKKGIDPERAAQAVSNAFVDYRYQSQADRVMRGLFPFSRFTVAQTPNTVGAIARQPVLTQPLRALMAGGVGPGTPNWLGDAPNIPIGTGPDGQQRILARTGHPLEDLSTFGGGEGMARTIQQGVLGRLNPLLRIPLEAVMEQSFFRGQPTGKDVRAPQAVPEDLIKMLGGQVKPPEQGGKRWPWEIDTAFRSSPVSRQITEISKLLDKRKPVWARSIDFITGAKVYDIDEDKELVRRLRDYLLTQVRDGKLGQVNRFFAYGDTDEELTAIIKDYYAIGRGKGKRGNPPAQGAAPKPAK